jgi:hypothetical protein
MKKLFQFRRAIGWALRLWKRKRNAAAMQGLYKSVDYLHEESSVLFWVPGGMPLLLDVEGAVAAALKLRQNKIHAIVCDGVFIACVKREITDGVSIHDWGDACNTCKQTCSNTLTQLGVPHSFIGDYVSDDELILAKKQAIHAKWETLTSIKYGNVSIGRNIKSGIQRYLKGYPLPEEPRLVEEYAYSGLVCAMAAHNAIKKIKPNKVIMSHGVYVDWGPALQTALELKIPIAVWLSSYLPARFYWRHVTDRDFIDPHNMSDLAWKKISSKAINVNEANRLEAYFVDRYQKNASFDMKHLMPYTGRVAEALARYRLEKAKPIWGILAHINWDAVSDFAPMLYDSFNEWMLDTLEIAKNVPEVQWLVKVHPAEAWDSLEGVEQLIKAKFPKLPDNIRVLPADENISPMDFFNMVDGAVSVYGTSGLELATKGKPVILAGDAHYGKKGFTLDAKDKDDYHKLLRNTPAITSLNPYQVELAKIYAYYYFILRQIPLSVVSNPNDKWWAFQFDKKERLLPGNDPAIDFLCARILDNREFIMHEELEAKIDS